MKYAYHYYARVPARSGDYTPNLAMSGIIILHKKIHEDGIWENG